MAASFVVSLLLQYWFDLSNDDPRQFAWIVIITVLCSTAIWLAATLLTAPESRETLIAFYRKVRPGAALWGPIAKLAPDIKPHRDGIYNLLDWAAGCVLVYMTLFATGKIIFGEVLVGVGLLIVAAAAGAVIIWDLNRRGWETVME
jgi:SSS family solute:Na+ symporter